MTIRFSHNFLKKAKKLAHHQPNLKLRIKRQCDLFLQNPRHPGLRLHKLKGKRSVQYAIWIEGDIRALAIHDGDMFLFFDLVTHDEY